MVDAISTQKGITLVPSTGENKDAKTKVSTESDEGDCSTETPEVPKTASVLMRSSVLQRTLAETLQSNPKWYGISCQKAKQLHDPTGQHQSYSKR